jgi:hypothetical protein
MIAMFNFAGLVLATIFAAAIAMACNWLMLQVTFHLMEPAAVHKPATQTLLARRTLQLARSFTPNH